MIARHLIAIFFAGAIHGAAKAGEYCVVCSGPPATYRCAIEGESRSAPADPRSQMRCIKELATQGRHETCSVERFSTVGCDGPERILAPLAMAPPPALPVDAVAPPAGPPTAKPAVSEAEKPKVPKTVEEFAKDTVKSSQESLKKAGEAVTGTAEKAGEKIGSAGESVGKAAKGTWHCITSWFTDC